MKTRLRMERPNGNKLTGSCGALKSSRPAGTVVAQCGVAGGGGLSPRWSFHTSVSSAAGGGCSCGWQCVWVAGSGARVIGVGAGMQGNVGLTGR